MKTLMMMFLFAMMTAVAYPQKLEVTIKKIRSGEGSVRVGLFANENEFLKKPSIGRTIRAQAGEVTVVFDDVRPGSYALSVIHDENENGALDSNIIGIPKEGFGFGNNAMRTFGPPSFEEASISVEQAVNRHVVELKYY